MNYLKHVHVANYAERSKVKTSLYYENKQSVKTSVLDDAKLFVRASKAELTGAFLSKAIWRILSIPGRLVAPLYTLGKGLIELPFVLDAVLPAATGFLLSPLLMVGDAVTAVLYSIAATVTGMGAAGAAMLGACSAGLVCAKRHPSTEYV